MFSESSKKICPNKENMKLFVKYVVMLVFLTSLFSQSLYAKEITTNQSFNENQIIANELPTIEQTVESDMIFIDEDEVGTFLPFEERSNLETNQTRSGTGYTVKRKLVNTARYNNNNGTSNVKNLGEVSGYGRMIRDGFQMCIGKPSNISVSLAFGPVGVAFSPANSGKCSYRSVPNELKKKYTRIYNYNEITVSKYELKYYEQYSGAYRFTKYTNSSTTQGWNYKAE